MSHVICHIELPVHDRAAAARFYTALCGWSCTHYDDMSYTVFSAPPGPGGGFTQCSERHPAGRTLVYVSTAAIDDSLAKVASLGGQTVVPRTEVPGIGWFAIFSDPSGNHLALWRAGGDPPEPQSPPCASPVAHVELHVNQRKAGAEFYGSLFGWELNHIDAMDYTLFGAAPGIGGGIMTQRHGPLVMVYLATADLEASLAQAQQLGAEVALEPMEVLGQCTIAAFKDPDGNLVGLTQPL